MTTTLNMDADELAGYWEAHSLNKNVMDLSDDTFQGFRNAVMKQKDFVPNTAVISRPTRPTTKRDGPPMVSPSPKRRSTDSISAPNTPGTPTGKTTTQTRVVSPSKPKFQDRKGAGDTVLTYSPQKLPAFATRQNDPQTTTAGPRCNIDATCFETNVLKPYRHMFTPVEERAKALDDHLTVLGDEMVEEYGIGTEHSNRGDLVPVGVPKQDKICCIGRICNEAHHGRMNETSVLLEGSHHFSGGARVQLDLSELKKNKASSYSLFPGQIVAVEGMNVSGRKIVAETICEGSAPPTTKTTASELLRMHHNVQDGRPLRIVQVCGPYTASNDQEYQPLVDLLLNVVKETKPDVVIMTGPLVDIDLEDPRVQLEDGTSMSATFEVFFNVKFAALVEELFDSEPDLPTQFVLVPSLNDAVAEWV